MGQAIVFRGLPSSSTVRRRQTTIVCATPGTGIASSRRVAHKHLPGGKMDIPSAILREALAALLRKYSEAGKNPIRDSTECGAHARTDAAVASLIHVFRVRLQYSVAAGHFGRGHLPQPFEAFASFIFERTESPGQLRELGWLGCRTCFSSGESEEFSAAAPSSRRAADWKKRCMQ